MSSIRSGSRNRVSAIKRRRRNGGRNPSLRRVALEQCEPRWAPAVVLWDGGPAATGTDWNSPVNWVGDVLPGAADDAIIGGAFAGATITSSANVTIRSVTSAAALQVASGTFALGAATSQIDAAFTISGGTLRMTGTTLNGSGTLTNASNVELTNCSLGVALVNQAELSVFGSVVWNGAFSNQVGAALRYGGFGAGVTVASGFTNEGLIELFAAPGFSPRLTVDNGTLTNAPSGIIRALHGGGQFQLLQAQLDNQGTLDVQTNLSLNRSSTAHTNSGVVNITGGDVDLLQVGESPSFTNTGSILIGSGRTVSIRGGAFHHDAGSISGDGALAFAQVNSSFSGDFSNGLASLTFTQSPVTSPGTITNPPGKTLKLTESTIDAALSNQGTLLVRGGGALNGAFSNLPGATLRVDGIGLTLGAHLTVANGFSNQGTIELTGDHPNFASQLTVTSGTLTNAPGATIRVSPVGDRFLTAQLDNQGTLVATLDVQNRLVISKPAAAHVNSGTITLSGRNFTIGQVDTGQTLTNTGVIDLASAGTLTFATDRVVNDGAGILTSHPAGEVVVSGSFSGTNDGLVGSTTNADRFSPQGTVQFTGPGSAVRPQLLEVLGEDRGSVAAGFTDNFALGALSLNINPFVPFVRLVDDADNFPGAGAEALYVNRLILPAGTTLDLNSFHLYARQMQINGTVLGGTVTQVPDSGPIEPNSSVAGAVGVSGEMDEWTFFGRAGETVTIVANPGGVGVPAPLAPLLNFVNVRLLSPAGAEIASGSSTTLGQIVTLQGVPLPADGTYRIEVRAASGGDVGNYALTLWNARVDTWPLQFNRRTNGTLETPFSVDRWTFTARANQQVTFDWLNAAPTTLQFKLTGPNNFTGFNNLTGDSGLVTLPADGAYVLEVTAGASLGGDYAFQLVETSQTELALGVPYTGTLIGSGQAQVFRIPNVPAGQQLRVVLDDSVSHNRNELFAGFGVPPTRVDFQFSATAPGADQQLFVPSAAPGTWYVLLHGATVPGVSTFTLTATTGDVFLSGVTPDRHGNGTEMALTLTGAGFDPSTIVELVDAEGTAYSANAVMVDLPTQVTATFDAGTVPPGTYSVRARRNGSAVLTDAFEVLAGGQPHLEVDLIAPYQVSRNTVASFNVEYANTGDTAMPAPLLVVNATDQALLAASADQLVHAFQTSAQPDGFQDTVALLGWGTTPGQLQPGERITVPIHYIGLQQPWNFSDTQLESTLTVLTADDARLIDWQSLESTLRPPSIPADAWTPIFANLVEQVGPTWGDFVAMLSDNAQYLGRLGLAVKSVDELWSFEVQQAIGFSPLPVLSVESDILVDAPGLPLTFTRVFSTSIVGRREQGLLGRGWAWADGWQRTLLREPDGTVVIAGLDGGQRRFEPDRRVAGRYFSQTGDHATLTGLSGGVFLLRELDGMATRYRGDGRVDYVEDANGNRVTATYVGAQLTRLTHSAGQFLDIAYNAAGRVANLSDQAGRTVVYGYDPSGEHLQSVRGIDGQTTRYTYSTGVGTATEHGLVSIEYADGTHEFFAYDPRGRLASVARDASAERVTFSYDSAGRVTTTEALGGATKYFFDHDGQLAAIEDALGHRTLLEYDNDFNLTRVTDALGQYNLFQYDSLGNLVRATNPLGQVTAFSYTADFNQLASLIDARGNPLNYGYDSRGNPTSITSADGTVERFTVDVRGELDASTNRRGQLIDYVVNADGRVERRALPDGSFIEYHYNARGNLDLATDASGTTVIEYLDPQNPDLPTKITYPNGRFLQYAYQAGRRTQMVDSDGFTTNFLYDAAGRLEFLRDGGGALIVQYHYDAAGRLDREDKGNGTFTEYEYDAAGQLEHLINRAPDGAVNSRFDYVYDVLGRRTRMTTLDGAWDYTYDGIGQLTRAVFTSNDLAVIQNQDLQYVYDAAGNRIRTITNGAITDYVTNNVNQYTRVGTESLTYDVDGNLVSRTDAGGAATYAYNALNRLIGVTAPGDAWSYQYDAFDNRVATIHNGQRTDYLVDPFGLGDVVGEYNAGGSLVADYVHGIGLASRVDSAGVAAYYDFDAIGSTAGLTDLSGASVNHYSYRPYGELLQTSEMVANSFQFVGQFGVMQQSNSLQFMRLRSYDDDIGRFVAEDPVGIRGGFNLYAYGDNNPVALTDPDGMSPSIVDAAKFFLGKEDQRRIINSIYSRKSSGPEGPCNPSMPALYPVLPYTLQLKPALDKALCLLQQQYERKRPPRPGAVIQYKDIKKPGPVVQYSAIVDFFAHDPNEKTGPGGYGAERYVPAGAALAYRIDFENEASATAPARFVVVTDQLDGNLDLDSFAWTEFGFGDVLVSVPAGRRHFQTTVPMTLDGQSFQVEVELYLDAESGRLTAVFDSIDPATFLPPDVLTGFLPPEDGTGRGQGHVSYVIRPRAGLPTGTQIRNVARIVFDVNEPIDTNQSDPHDPASAVTDPAHPDYARLNALNTIDAGLPSSMMQALPAQSPQQFVELRWEASDDASGSGVASVDIFRSIDGGPFELFLDDLPGDATTVRLAPGHDYAFYTVARDNVGHEEGSPIAPDAATRIIPGDTNADGVIDLNDLNGVRNFFGAQGPNIPGDTDLDDDVDLDDLNNVRNFFGASFQPAPVQGRSFAFVPPAMRVDPPSRRTRQSDEERRAAADAIFGGLGIQPAPIESLGRKRRDPTRIATMHRRDGAAPP